MFTDGFLLLICVRETKKLCLTTPAAALKVSPDCSETFEHLDKGTSTTFSLVAQVHLKYSRSD